MTWRAMTKAASGVACAVPAECTCRPAAHCHSTHPRQMEPSVRSALHAAVRRCVASGQADELPVTAKMAGRPSALRSKARASLSSKDGARHKRQEACDAVVLRGILARSRTRRWWALRRFAPPQSRPWAFHSRGTSSPWTTPSIAWRTPRLIGCSEIRQTIASRFSRGNEYAWPTSLSSSLAESRPA